MPSCWQIWDCRLVGIRVNEQVMTNGAPQKKSEQKNTKVPIAKKIPTTLALLMIQAHIHFGYFFDI